ncbi:O-antigen ligase [Azospirillum rugosum]|nr:O-antigen ligase [Azospirillum rugosum]
MADAFDRSAPARSRSERAAAWGQAILAASIAYLILQHSPLSGDGGEFAAEGSGNGIRQLVWMALFAASAPLAWLARERLLPVLLRLWPLWLALAWCWMSIAWSAAPAVSVKRLVLMTIIVLVCVTAVSAIGRLSVVWRTIALTLAAIVAIDIAVALLVPSLGRGADGSFTGIHTTKNTAGAFASITILIWSFWMMTAAGTRWWQVSIVVCLCTLLFLAGTGSKTSLGAVGLSGAIAFFLGFSLRAGPLAGALAANVMLAGGAVVALAVTLLSPRRVLLALFGDATLTGRTELWAFLWQFVDRHFFTGVGYQALWMTGSIGLLERWQPTFLNWAIQQAHNGYLDALLTVGAVGLALGIVVLLSALFMSLAMERRADCRGYGILGAALVIFAMIHNLTESSLLRPDHMVWGMTILALACAALPRHDASR